MSGRRRTSDCAAAQWSSDEATALFTTGMGDTIRERAIAETPARTGREVVYSEVTAIFTTDREQVGGEQATLLPLRRALTELRHFCRRDLNHATSEPQKADGALTRSNSDLHHRLAEAHCCTRQS